jgi:hypothetical protein
MPKAMAWARPGQGQAMSGSFGLAQVLSRPKPPQAKPGQNITRDELTSLKDAKSSPDWPEWEKAMKIELDSLLEKGTWELVQKPPDAVPISNK